MIVPTVSSGGGLAYPRMVAVLALEAV